VSNEEPGLPFLIGRAVRIIKVAMASVRTE
jgi:hypothetical protein